MAEEATNAPAPTPNPGTPAPQPQPQPGGPTSPPPAPAPPPVPNPQAELTTMLLQRTTAAELRAAELEAAERSRVAEAARKEQDLLAEKGNTEAAKAALQAAREAHDRELAAERGKLAEIERRSRTHVRDRELALALSGKPLVEGSAPQLIKLLRDAVDAYPEGPGYVVRTADFVSVDDLVARELAKPEYAHFLRATNTGGVNAGGNVPAPTRTAAPAVNATERMAQQLKASIEAGRGNAPGLAGNYGAPGLAGNYVGSN